MLVAPKRCKALSPGNHQILLQFAVGHGVGGHAQVLRAVFEGDGEGTEGHAAAQLFCCLVEGRRRPKRFEARRKVAERLLVEVGIAIVSKECAVDLPLLQTFENGKSLRFSLRRRLRVKAEDDWRQLAANGARCW